MLSTAIALPDAVRTDYRGMSTYDWIIASRRKAPTIKKNKVHPDRKDASSSSASASMKDKEPTSVIDKGPPITIELKVDGDSKMQTPRGMTNGAPREAATLTPA